MNARWPSRLAWTGAVLGLLAALLVFAPARWLANSINAATNDQLQLVNARGTVWRGRADLMFTGGQGSQTRTTLPQGVQWRISPTLVSGLPAMALRLEAPCCTVQPVALTARPLLGGAEVRLAAFSSRWPAELLIGLGTPWNTLRMEGQLSLQTSGLTLRWDSGRGSMQGVLAVEAQDMVSRLSTLRPLGSYRMDVRAEADSNTTTLALQTLNGRLQLQGQGQWVGGRLRFQGVAEAAPDSEAALNNLLNIIGRRQGPRSLLNIG
ncbi:MAG: type II secretion system protein N [Hydrogenophaga sp.]|uniref:type II secretion system protein N n=1 Tax=Hydrogenophaga sp. TaxID=1904254 RepID=UPI002720B9C0|nr:type II secretion system protein N [Hydrogenophaga sp.]MDO9133659.1 type II secretion system protein N [Hydrogenophaga sp.]MDO9505706.1 type II secretion system protein N [Hydrogenophaga sp.]MDP3204868.1 type II secretion system protein N [Hydrogenophaga sp.]MDP3627337.1 type II secretion system protein N [Hydrogenophaga sp.]